MTITVFFDVQATAAQYDGVMKDLAAANAVHPRGRLFHVAQPNEGAWSVVDVWESRDTFQDFGKTLMPILGKNGIPQPQIRILPTHNIVRPSSV